MPDLNPPEPGADCPFCRIDSLDTVLYEGDGFYVIADFAPVADAHVLLIPRGHYPHIAALPEALHAEFEALKARLGDFVRSQYGALTFWENGVFGQSVPHAHQHVVSMSLDDALYRGHGPVFEGIAGLRERYQAAPTPYFTVEQGGDARFLPPDWDLYLRVIQYARSTHGGQWLLSRDERRVHGLPIIEALRQRWRENWRPESKR